jgi:hypothetical protein
MRSFTLFGSALSETSVPSLERSLFSWILTTLTISTILFGLVGWVVGKRLQKSAINFSDFGQLSEGKYQFY